MFKKLLKWIKSLFNKSQTRKIDDLHVLTPIHTDDDLMRYKENEKLLVYPKAIQYSEHMRTRGTYANGYPRGAVIHFTAGRSRKGLEGGSRALETHKAMGVKSVKYAIEKNAYCYFINARYGNIHQAFNLNKYGYHAGKSFWKGVGHNVSSELVGIESQCAGDIEK